jgi:hypothetical protein
VAGSKSGLARFLSRRQTARSNFSHLFEARYNQPMPYKMNPGGPRSCSDCGAPFIALICNNLTCSPKCALHRKTDLQGRDGDRVLPTALQYCGPAALYATE